MIFLINYYYNVFFPSHIVRNYLKYYKHTKFRISYQSSPLKRNLTIQVSGPIYIKLEISKEENQISMGV